MIILSVVFAIYFIFSIVGLVRYQRIERDQREHIDHLHDLLKQTREMNTRWIKQLEQKVTYLTEMLNPTKYSTTPRVAAISLDESQAVYQNQKDGLIYPVNPTEDQMEDLKGSRVVGPGEIPYELS